MGNVILKNIFKFFDNINKALFRSIKEKKIVARKKAPSNLKLFQFLKLDNKAFAKWNHSICRLSLILNMSLLFNIKYGYVFQGK